MKGQIGLINAEKSSLESISNLMDNNIKSGSNDTLMRGGRVFNKKELGLKNPHIAVFTGLVPGFFVRGAGHVYVRHYGIAVILFGISAAGYYGLKRTFDMAAGGGGDEGASLLIGIPSIIMFVVPWFYDWMVAPVICDRENREKIKALTLQPYVKINRIGNQTGLRFSYRF